jgi:protein required for attachment to host cells
MILRKRRMIMLIPHGAVFALVDGEKFELYRNSGNEAHPKLESVPVPAVESTNHSAGTRDHDKVSRFGFGAPKDKLDKMEERSHAIAVAEWLNQEVLQHRIKSLVIMADPRSLGEMRRRYHKELEKVLLREVDATMAGATPEAIIEKLRAVH